MPRRRIAPTTTLCPKSDRPKQKNRQYDVIADLQLDSESQSHFDDLLSKCQEASYEDFAGLLPPLFDAVDSVTMASKLLRIMSELLDSIMNSLPEGDSVPVEIVECMSIFFEIFREADRYDSQTYIDSALLLRFQNLEEYLKDRFQSNTNGNLEQNAESVGYIDLLALFYAIGEEKHQDQVELVLNLIASEQVFPLKQLKLLLFLVNEFEPNLKHRSIQDLGTFLCFLLIWGPRQHKIVARPVKEFSKSIFVAMSGFQRADLIQNFISMIDGINNGLIASNSESPCTGSERCIERAVYSILVDLAEIDATCFIPFRSMMVNRLMFMSSGETCEPETIRHVCDILLALHKRNSSDEDAIKYMIQACRRHLFSPVDRDNDMQISEGLNICIKLASSPVVANDHLDTIFRLVRSVFFSGVNNGQISSIGSLCLRCLEILRERSEPVISSGQMAQISWAVLERTGLIQKGDEGQPIGEYFERLKFLTIFREPQKHPPFIICLPQKSDEMILREPLASDKDCRWIHALLSSFFRANRARQSGEKVPKWDPRPWLCGIIEFPDFLNQDIGDPHRAIISRFSSDLNDIDVLLETPKFDPPLKALRCPHIGIIWSCCKLLYVIQVGVSLSVAIFQNIHAQNSVISSKRRISTRTVEALQFQLLRLAYFKNQCSELGAFIHDSATLLSQQLPRKRGKKRRDGSKRMYSEPWEMMDEEALVRCAAQMTEQFQPRRFGSTSWSIESDTLWWTLAYSPDSAVLTRAVQPLAPKRTLGLTDHIRFVIKVRIVAIEFLIESISNSSQAGEIVMPQPEALTASIRFGIEMLDVVKQQRELLRACPEFSITFNRLVSCYLRMFCALLTHSQEEYSTVAKIICDNITYIGVRQVPDSIGQSRSISVVDILIDYAKVCLDLEILGSLADLLSLLTKREEEADATQVLGVSVSLISVLSPGDPEPNLQPLPFVFYQSTKRPKKMITSNPYLSPAARDRFCASLDKFPTAGSPFTWQSAVTIRLWSVSLHLWGSFKKVPEFLFKQGNSLSEDGYMANSAHPNARLTDLEVLLDLAVASLALFEPSTPADGLEIKLKSQCKGPYAALEDICCQIGGFLTSFDQEACRRDLQQIFVRSIKDIIFAATFQLEHCINWRNGQCIPSLADSEAGAHDWASVRYVEHLIECLAVNLFDQVRGFCRFDDEITSSGEELEHFEDLDSSSLSLSTVMKRASKFVSELANAYAIDTSSISYGKSRR